MVKDSIRSENVASLHISRGDPPMARHRGAYNPPTIQ